MKKSIKNAVNKIVLLLSFALLSIPALANTGAEMSEGIDYGQLVRMPEFWVALVLFIGFIAAALMVGKSKREMEVQ